MTFNPANLSEAERANARYPGAACERCGFDVPASEGGYPCFVSPWSWKCPNSNRWVQR